MPIMREAIRQVHRTLNQRAEKIVQTNNLDLAHQETIVGIWYRVRKTCRSCGSKKITILKDGSTNFRFRVSHGGWLKQCRACESKQRSERRRRNG